MGSSTALGSAATSYDSSYAGRLQAFYRKNTAAGNPDTIVTAVGGYGYTTYKFLPNGYVPPVIRHSVDGNVNVNAVLAMNPDIVIINLPGNDVSSYAQPWISPVYSTKETMDNFRVMYSFFVSNNVKCFVTTTQPRNDLDVSQRQLQRNLVDSITNNFGTFSINFWDDLVVPGGSNLLKDEVRNVGYADQDYHLNNTGHRYIFERVKNKDIFQTSIGAPLPVKFSGFDAKKEGSGVRLTWNVETEENLAGYQVEKSNDGTRFSTIGTVQAEGRSSYSFVDAQPLTGKTFYRIKSLDIDGKYQYSPVASLNGGKSSLVLKAFPLPVVNKITIQHTAANALTRISISAEDGRIIKSIMPAKGAIQTSVDLSSIKAGLYFVRFDNGNGEVETLKLMKQ